MSEPIAQEPAVAALLAKLAAFVPGFAGAVLSLAFVENLTIRGRVITVIVGMCAAAFLAPAMADLASFVWPGGAIPRSVSSAIQFLVALCAMGCIPPLLAWLQKIAGDPLSLLRGRLGG